MVLLGWTLTLLGHSTKNLRDDIRHLLPLLGPLRGRGGRSLSPGLTPVAIIEPLNFCYSYKECRKVKKHHFSKRGRGPSANTMEEWWFCRQGCVLCTLEGSDQGVHVPQKKEFQPRGTREYRLCTTDPISTETAPTNNQQPTTNTNKLCL